MRRRYFILALSKLIFIASIGLIRGKGLYAVSLSPKKSNTIGQKQQKNIRVLLYRGDAEKLTNLNVSKNHVYYKKKEFPFITGPSDVNYAGIIVDKALPLKIRGQRYFGKIIVIKNGDYDYQIINQLPIEDYLLGVVGYEISAKWHPSVIQAQAIAARSYAYSFIHKAPKAIYHVDGTEKFQVFKGNIDAAEESVRNGIAKTRDRILTYQKIPITTFFHSCCGGMTEKAENVWKQSQKVPYFKNIRCPYCKNFSLYNWRKKISLDEINKKLAVLNVGNIKSLKVSKRSYSKRVEKIQVVGELGRTKIDGARFRSILSSQKFFSTIFRIKKQNDSLHFIGNGNGHGVGLCQAGAKTMAEKGYATEKILSFYYKSIRFDTITSLERIKQQHQT